MAITDKEFGALTTSVEVIKVELKHLNTRFDERTKSTRTLIQIVFAQVMATAGGFLLLYLGKR